MPPKKKTAGPPEEDVVMAESSAPAEVAEAETDIEIDEQRIRIVSPSETETLHVAC